MSAITSALTLATRNRANAQHSTGPRTDAGKQRSSQNALRHGLTARSTLLPSEDLAPFQQHRQQFFDEYQPATATETQLVQELANTAWRLNRIPTLEADILTSHQQPATAPESPAPSPQSLVPTLSMLGLHSSRLSRQFQKALNQLLDIQADRHQQEKRDLRTAADILELHKRKGIPWQPSDHGFVFSQDQVERHADFLMRQNESRQVGYFRFDVPPQLARAVQPK